MPSIVSQYATTYNITYQGSQLILSFCQRIDSNDQVAEIEIRVYRGTKLLESQVYNGYAAGSDILQLIADRNWLVLINAYLFPSNWELDPPSESDPPNPFDQIAQLRAEIAQLRAKIDRIQQEADAAFAAGWNAALESRDN